MTDGCGNPNDTGKQLMASGIGYDDRATQLNAAHVQAAIEALFALTGQNDHTLLKNLEAPDQHPQSAIIGLIDALAGKANQSHQQPATTVSFDKTILNVLGAEQVQAAIDELTTIAQSGLIEYGATAIEVVADEGIAASVNQMDWTGHPYADSVVPTALNIQENHVVTFSNGTAELYRYVGAKPRLVGVGSGQTTVDSDYAPVGTSDHNLLINRSSADCHPIAAITGLQAALDALVPEAPNDGKQYGRQGTAWTEISSDAASLRTGWKNVLINPFFLVNQRAFDGNWSIIGNGVYTYDRWKKHDTDNKKQVIEDPSLIFGATYTLTWSGGGSATVTNSGGNFSGESPLVGVVNQGSGDDTEVILPISATNPQLELGDIRDSGGQYIGTLERRPFGLEIGLCQRFYTSTAFIYLVPGHMFAGNSRRVASHAFPTTIRDPDNATVTFPATNNLSADPTYVLNGNGIALDAEAQVTSPDAITFVRIEIESEL